MLMTCHVLFNSELICWYLFFVGNAMTDVIFFQIVYWGLGRNRFWLLLQLP